MNNLHYQFEYASGRPQMYEKSSRIIKAKRVEKTLADFLGNRDQSKLKVLDVGGSSGIIANELSKKFKSVTVMDIDKGALKFAKQTFKRKNLYFRFGDAMNLPLKNNSFDIVVCTHVYEHVPYPKKLFQEIYRVLKPGGVCYLAAQNKLWPLEAHHNLPFLSYLPKKAADLYIRVIGKKEYYEHPMSYWQLFKILRKFTIHDFTPNILSQPKKYGYKNISLPFPIANLVKYFTPTMFWILEK